ncbi:type II secretion system minor pseudopilin GspH [Beggiatoa leptomitoformis]|uniref:Type II secretion system protein H n=1 Tax=Beggiatoa leptomitoformis TaxID=288004 RepID=A0A2N9YA64_9GAMM|nr:type II secretion system minor pseudopilin GspH [Beggiatoa leptomitoformis]AUI67351.1 type II secretion system minor pseudopilin GspH [Beggiatoa leptomitoformis]QGX03571.1 type II secretion system minor pseudopilin GspH [Beggiatoa leptomitoformis]
MPCYIFPAPRLLTTQTVSCKTSSNMRGFTLIELLVTAIIIGIILSVASLAINDGGLDRQLQNEAERIVALLTLTSQEAILQSEEQGLYIETEGYYFYHLNEENQWKLLENDELRRPRQFTANIQAELQVEGKKVLSEDTTTHTPQIVIFSSGEFTPFTLRLRSAINTRLSYVIKSNNLGNLTVTRDDW